MSFLQDGACHTVAPTVGRCRECLDGTSQADLCRFVAFRRLSTRLGELEPAGFADSRDCLQEDLKLWLPRPDARPSEADINKARLVLEQLANLFCDLFKDEQSVLENWQEVAVAVAGERKTVVWKRVVQDVREMCDVCETTLFNLHWVCGNCGFVACVDCYRDRKSDLTSDSATRKIVADEWLLCKEGAQHGLDQLMLTQIVAANSFVQLWKKVVKLRLQLETPQYCVESFVETQTRAGLADLSKSWQEWLTDVACDAEEENSQNGKLLAILSKPTSNPLSLDSTPDWTPGTPGTPGTLDDMISSKLAHTMSTGCFRRLLRPSRGNQSQSLQVMNFGLCKITYPDVPLSWLCDGRLLLLTDPDHPGNYEIFHDQWQRGQPVIISKVHKKLTAEIWSPEAFSRDFRGSKVDLVNYSSDKVVPQQPMHKFWDGFMDSSKRMRDSTGSPMLLKVKDWPPSEDFATLLPARFEELMTALPMAEYTDRSGALNLVSNLPGCFVRPDLGPKMYSAYGRSSLCLKATTNLHLDVSDAVNVMVHVGNTSDADKEEQDRGALRAMEEAGCDLMTKRRVQVHGEIPGAVWHIYNAQDADKIRDLLNRVSVESELGLHPNNDPIHDQNRFLDAQLRARLYKEYGVLGYVVLQCLGDAVFIPAGAPHQVCNINNCIKVAEDFVSPENISRCFHLTQEFRELTKGHANHEDKLQVKNIIYHSVKEAVAILSTLSTLST